MLKNIFDEIAKAHGIDKAAPSGTGEVEVSGDAQYPVGDVRSLNDTFEKMIWVYRCVSIIATNIAMLPIKVYRITRDGSKEDVSHLPEFAIFQKPNKHQTRFDFWMETISRLKLQGEFFWELEYAGRGVKPVAVYADWRSEEVRILSDPQEFIVGYERYVNGKLVKYPAEQVFFVKYFNPSSSYRGMSPLRAGRSTLILELNAIEFNKQFFKHGMRPSGLVTLPREPSQAELDRLREQFNELYTGTKKAHSVAFMWGNMKFQPLAGMNLTDAEFTVLRQMNREEIAGLYGVPLEILGVGKATYENWKEARKSFWQETLLPDLMKVYSLINEHFLPRITNRQDVVVEPDLSGVTVLKDDIEAKAKRFFDGFKNAAVTPNMILTQVFGGDPVDDPAMNSFYLPLNVQPVAQADTGAKGIKKKTESVAKQTTYEERTRHWWNIIKQVEPDEKAFAQLMKRFFKKQEKEVVAQILDLEEKGIKVDLRVEGRIFDMERWVAELEKLGGPALVERVRESMQMVMESEPDLLHPAVRVALGNRVSRFSTFVNETTARQIQEVLREAMAEQLSIQEIAARVQKKVFDTSVTTRRAATIARTEVMGAHNFGLQHGMRQGGHKRKMWLTSRDNDVRTSHKIDGQVVGIDESFLLADGREMEFPHDFNERCTMMPTKQPRNRPDRPETRPASAASLGPEFSRDASVLQKLTTDEIREAQELGGGVNKTVVLSDGIRGVFKPLSGEMALQETAMKHEVAAYRIDRIFNIDMTPPTVIREYGGELGSHQLFMDGYKIIREAESWVGKISEIDKEKLTLFDWMLQNTDRHGANLMVNASGKLAAIDNGYTFSIPEFYTPFEKLGIPLQDMKFKRWFKKHFTFKAVLRVKELVYEKGLLTETEFKGFLGRVWQVLDEEMIPFDYSFGTNYFKDSTIEEALKILEKAFKEFKL